MLINLLNLKNPAVNVVPLNPNWFTSHAYLKRPPKSVTTSPFVSICLDTH
jgi:hypothetical protein